MSGFVVERLPSERQIIPSLSLNCYLPKCQKLHLMNGERAACLAVSHDCCIALTQVHVFSCQAASASAKKLAGGCTAADVRLSRNIHRSSGQLMLSLSLLLQDKSQFNDTLGQAVCCTWSKEAWHVQFFHAAASMQQQKCGNLQAVFLILSDVQRGQLSLIYNAPAELAQPFPPFFSMRCLLQGMASLPEPYLLDSVRTD